MRTILTFLFLFSGYVFFSCISSEHTYIGKKVNNILLLSNEIDKIALELFHLRYSGNNDDSTINKIIKLDDSLGFANKKLKDFLLTELQNDFFNSNEILQLNENGKIKVAESSDKKLNVFSWNSNLGGTMDQYFSIAQYKNHKNIISVKVLYEVDSLNYPLHFNVQCDSIFQILLNDTQYYFLFGSGKLGTRLIYNSLNIISLNDENIILNNEILVDSIGQRHSFIAFQYKLENIKNNNPPSFKVDSFQNKVYLFSGGDSSQTKIFTFKE